jgi:hypothetical protein
MQGISPALAATAVAIVLAGSGVAAFSQTPKIPFKSDDQGSLYVSPNVTSNETTTETRGATVGVERKDGGATYGGVDTSGTRPTYSLGGATGGSVSYSAGVQSDGKDNKGVKAGVTIKY